MVTRLARKWRHHESTQSKHWKGSGPSLGSSARHSVSKDCMPSSRSWHSTKTLLDLACAAEMGRPSLEAVSGTALRRSHGRACSELLLRQWMSKSSQVQYL